MENNNFTGFAYSEKMAPVKEEYIQKLTSALEANQNYIDALYEEINKKSEEVSKRKLEEEKKNENNGKKKSKKTEKDGLEPAVVHVNVKDDVNKYDEYVSCKAFMDYYEKNLGKDSDEYLKEKRNYEKLDKSMQTLKTGLNEIKEMEQKKVSDERKEYKKTTRSEVRKHNDAAKVEANIKKMKTGRMNLDEFSVKVTAVKTQVKAK